jgi:hypothetical protein
LNEPGDRDHARTLSGSVMQMVAGADPSEELIVTVTRLISHRRAACI